MGSSLSLSLSLSLSFFFSFFFEQTPWDNEHLPLARFRSGLFFCFFVLFFFFSSSRPLEIMSIYLWLGLELNRIRSGLFVFFFFFLLFFFFDQTP